jgi:hypothetical protein
MQRLVRTPVRSPCTIDLSCTVHNHVNLRKQTYDSKEPLTIPQPLRHPNQQAEPLLNTHNIPTPLQIPRNIPILLPRTNHALHPMWAEVPCNAVEWENVGMVEGFPDADLAFESLEE